MNVKGAILFSPPEKTVLDNGYDTVGKMHICKECYREILQFGLKNILWKQKHN